MNCGDSVELGYDLWDWPSTLSREDSGGAWASQSATSTKKHQIICKTPSQHSSHPGGWHSDHQLLDRPTSRGREKEREREREQGKCWMKEEGVSTQHFKTIIMQQLPWGLWSNVYTWHVTCMQLTFNSCMVSQSRDWSVTPSQSLKDTLSTSQRASVLIQVPARLVMVLSRVM